MSKGRQNVPELLAVLDSYYSKNDLDGAGSFLEAELDRVKKAGDWSAELSLLSEQMGYFRRTGDRKKGIAACEKGMDLIKEHNLGDSVSGATVLLNAATTLKAFSLPERSAELFLRVERVYGKLLRDDDYRMAGLYNNAALTFVDLGNFAEAEKRYKKALSVLDRCRDSENEKAVTFCNMAYMYAAVDPTDGRVEEVMKAAERCLEDPETQRDGYYAFTASKCRSAFEYFGFFAFAEELGRRAEEIYEGN